VKKAATLIEMIFVLILMSFLIIGAFKLIQRFYKRSYMVTKSSELQFKSQQVIDEIALLLYYRVPLSLIGYNQNTGNYKYIGYIDSGEDYPIVEWIGFENDAIKDANLSGFIDMDDSNSTTKTVKCLDFNKNYVERIIQNKFNTTASLDSLAAIIFAGTFDRGEEDALNDYSNAFGWHGGGHNFIYTFTSSQNGNDTNLTLDTKPNKIYDKFFLIDSAYALARVADLDKTKWNCSELDINKLKNNDLLLFYNFRPWKGESFCGDSGEGNVTLLSSNVKAFFVKKINLHLELKMEFFKSKDDINISVSKQKVAF